MEYFGAARFSQKLLSNLDKITFVAKEKIPLYKAEHHWPDTEPIPRDTTTGEKIYPYSTFSMINAGGAAFDTVSSRCIPTKRTHENQRLFVAGQEKKLCSAAHPMKLTEKTLQDEEDKVANAFDKATFTKADNELEIEADSMLLDDSDMWVLGIFTDKEYDGKLPNNTFIVSISFV